MKTGETRPATVADPKQARLAKALRANLKRRREQVKRREAAPVEAGDEVDPVAIPPQIPLKQPE